jgi:hypothetical protein
MICKSFSFHNLQCASHNYTYVYILLDLNRFGLKSALINQSSKVFTIYL